MNIGKKIKELRDEQDLSQEELAKALNISRSTLANYEVSASQVPNDLIPLIAKHFGVTIDFLFGLKEM